MPTRCDGNGWGRREGESAHRLCLFQCCDAQFDCRYSLRRRAGGREAGARRVVAVVGGLLLFGPDADGLRSNGSGGGNFGLLPTHSMLSQSPYSAPDIKGRAHHVVPRRIRFHVEVGRWPRTERFQSQHRQRRACIGVCGDPLVIDASVRGRRCATRSEFSPLFTLPVRHRWSIGGGLRDRDGCLREVNAIDVFARTRQRLLSFCEAQTRTATDDALENDSGATSSSSMSCSAELCGLGGFSDDIACSKPHSHPQSRSNPCHVGLSLWLRTEKASRQRRGPNLSRPRRNGSPRPAAPTQARRRCRRRTGGQPQSAADGDGLSV